MEMLTRAWRNRAQRLRLIGLIDMNTGGVEFPPKSSLEKTSGVIYDASSISFSKSPSYTSDNCMEVQEVQQPQLAQ